MQLPAIVSSEDAEVPMDAIYLGMIVAFFALTWLVVKLLERV